MTCEISFLPVGNADCIVISDNNDSAVVVDIGKKTRSLQQWLKNKNKKNIKRIYITHAHNDHLPPLDKLVEFLDLWLKQGEVETFCFPLSFYKISFEKLIANRGKSPKYDRLEMALHRLDDWDRLGRIRFIPASRYLLYTQENLEIRVLHPRQFFLEKPNTKPNEISLVLRVIYGDFAAILLADIENAGLKECVDICKQDELTSNVVKVPHHGAYPKNGDDLKQLLETINAEIAVLSVGSTNIFGHVVPELFNLLINLQNDDSKRLKKFACTEVTRTCVKSASDRSSMGKSGLTAQQLCAGEITILAETSGKWTLKTQTDHENVISSLPYPACQGRAELGAISI
ncbi:ComEC/Rec2 family competence protein [Nodularia sp. UHCC 0506]|uniref:ComEC/Rec2 family competence protein n=1 Tax=Nodularia sp. UHCC 0506 TaxID=3110243 RepID=UPI002B218B16|nr:MBL fold metallo-hydrolase [Nodularia sp. UHCC 0506]MEA5514898.1 MBL fold metallo-hydrolase [Nodularia sp. UHCC 0506]